MNITEIKKVLPYLIKAQITPCLIGRHGSGKSQVVEQFAKENGYDTVVSIRLGQLQDPGDLTGLPEFVDIKTKDGTVLKATEFIPPTFFPRNGEKVVVFLDEYNRCPPQLLQSVFQLIEKEHKIGTYTLPEGCAVILASNPPTDDYTVTDLQDKALMDRMLPIKFEPSNEEFFSYMTDVVGANKAITDFLREMPEAIEVRGEDFSIDQMVEPSKRSWDAYQRLEKTGIIEAVDNSTFLEVMQGLVGLTGAVSYNKWLENYESFVTIDDVLENYSKVKKKLSGDKSIDEINNIIDTFNTEVFGKRYLTDKNLDNFYSFIFETVPTDLGIAFFSNVTKLISTKTKIGEGGKLLDEEVPVMAIDKTDYGIRFFEPKEGSKMEKLFKKNPKYAKGLITNSNESED